MNAGVLRSYTITPEDAGLRRASLKEIKGGDAQANRGIILGVLDGDRGPRRDVVMLNAAAALLASSRAENFSDGVALAAESIDSGKAREKLQSLIDFTNQ